MSFGKTLQRIRRSKGLTQRRVADLIEMDYGYFSRIENDRSDSNPTRMTIDKIAEAMNCSEEERGELLTEAGRLSEKAEAVARIATQNEPLTRLFKTASHLSPDRLEKLEKLANQLRDEMKKSGKKS
jgi:HTH-type transcriptional regulator, competence development regulator